jgi:hypothetical protein
MCLSYRRYLGLSFSIVLARLLMSGYFAGSVIGLFLGGVLGRCVFGKVPAFAWHKKVHSSFTAAL